MTYFDIDGTLLWKKNRAIEIGYKGEAIVTRVIFDVSDIIENIGEGGTFSLVASLNNFNSGTPYSCTVTYSDKKLYWIVDAGTLAYIGQGTIQYSYTLGNQIKKSAKIPVKITSSLTITSSSYTPSASGDGTVVFPNASATTVGGIKLYFDSTNSKLYITNNGNDPTPTT